MGCGASSVAPVAAQQPEKPPKDPVEEKHSSHSSKAPKLSLPVVNTIPHEGVSTRSLRQSRSDSCRSISAKIQSQRKTLTLQENLVKTDGFANIRDFYDLGDKSKVLGTGMTGAVRQVRRLSDNKKFALKTISLHNMNDETVEELQNEIDILKSLDHPHIGKLYETYEDPGVQIHLVLEMCTGGELFDRLMDKRTFTEKHTAELVYNMLKALHYLHCKNVVHRDLKLENWLFRTPKDDAEIVLIDFGLSAHFRERRLLDSSEEEHMHSKVGTSYYIAPEVLDGDYTSSCDMWSLGVIVYMLLSGTAPFGGDDDEQILKNVMKHNYTMKGEQWAHISDDATDFVRKLLEVNPSTRMTAEEALHHPWMSKEASLHPQVQLDMKTFDNLKRFKEFHELKRVAMEVVAFSLDHEEIKKLSDMFEGIDDDHNGFVTFRELKAALQRNKNVSDEEVKEIFDAIDEEHTGLIHINEFIAAALAEKDYMDEKHLRDCFTRMDTLGTGTITRDSLKELLGRCVSEERADEMLREAKMFANHDGKDDTITFQDFMLFMQRDGHDKDFVDKVKRS